ncbi:cytosolic phospholipase A2 zeta [Aureobasidium subglaciale]|nr:cytosolic phospholipase A2 zeta [Aureobasidium subglaciale]
MLRSSAFRLNVKSRGACRRQLHQASPSSVSLRRITTRGVAGAVVFAGTVYLSYPPQFLQADSSKGSDDSEGWFSWPVIVQQPSSQPRNEESQGTTTGNDVNQSRPGQQAPPSQTKGHTASDINETLEASDVSAWHTMVGSFETAKDSIVNFEISKIGEKIAGTIVPKWVKVLPGYISKLQSELSMAPGSLAEEIWHEANDPEINPEIIWDARVRVSDEICKEEREFLKKRKRHTTAALARYLDIPEADIHPADVPTIAMCGSGGGLRALVAGTSSYLSAQEAGLFDCVTYTAGVSGSCWLQTLFYSSVGQQSHGRMINHLKSRLNVHIAYPPAALSLLSSAPTSKYLLSGIVEKMKGVPDADFGLVDVYGLLLGARLLVPKGELGISDHDFKISNQRQHTDTGAYPLPIYTAVRHEIPEVAQTQDRAMNLQDETSKAIARAESWFQWFEWTPYEFFCEEFGAGIPTWAIGRKFDGGYSVYRDNGLALPELRVPLLMGIWGSAFCATLSHYYKEVRPIVRSLAGFSGIDQLIAEKDDDLTKVHPFEPASIPNFAANMESLLPQSCPQSVHGVTTLQLMDAGMSNNLPIYPLLRPGRDIDVLIAFDASADVRQDNWIKVTDGYVKQRGIKGWPLGAGWPTEELTEEQTLKELEQAQATSEKEATDRIEHAQHANDSDAVMKGEKVPAKPSDLGYCTVWVGTTEERESDTEPPMSKKVEEDWEVMRPDAGIAVVYFPFLKNDKVPGVDPQTSDFMSTWNFVYTTEEIDKVVSLARANFEEGKDQTRRTIRAVWERKRNHRLAREEEAKEIRRQTRMRKVNNNRCKQYGDHGDQFS